MIDRFRELRDDIASGRKKLGEIDIETELALLGLGVVIHQGEHLERLQAAVKAAEPQNIPKDPKTLQIVWALNAHPDLVKPVADALAGLLEAKRG